jgi:20S proteasome alpha/beta subunit
MLPAARDYLEKIKRLSGKRKAMTIALGVLCEGGAIVAADTKVVDTNGMTTQAYKVFHFIGQNASFAIANASNDVNAALTMIRKIQAALQSTAFKTWKEIEEVIAYEMSDFSQPYKTPPEHQLVVAGFLKGGGIGLYFCEPPNTVLSKMFEGYVSAGGGAAIADPLHDSLFGFSSSSSPQVALRQIAYLMYRSKNHAFCGGETTAFYVRDTVLDVEGVRLRDFAEAETRMHRLDFLLRMTAHAILREPNSDDKNTPFSIRGAPELGDIVFHDMQQRRIEALPR